MIQKTQKLICRLFGHSKLVTIERYAIKLDSVEKTRYDVVEDTYCQRCGELLERKLIAQNLSRTQMLQEGWFIMKQEGWFIMK